MKPRVPGAYNRSDGKVFGILGAEKLALFVPAAQADGEE